MRQAIICLLSLVWLVACDGVPPGSMVPLRPPTVWQESLESFRASRDTAFRTSPDSPLLAEDVHDFGGLRYWPPDSRFYFAGPIHVYAQKEQFDIVTTAGKSRPCERFGWIEFPLDGGARRLQVYRLLDTDLEPSVGGLLLPFTDGTTGEETYPSGRYVDLEGPPGEIQIVTGPTGDPVALGPFVLDFNRAYNPSCAYGAPERFACPVTPKDNRLGVRIEAGERGFKLPAARDG
jgi:uncharacterized protein (DUF1684 family)